MKPTNPPQSIDLFEQEAALAARQAAWRTSSALLAALTMLNFVLVPVIDARIDNSFVLTNGINLLLAFGLWKLWTWARYLTLLRVLLGIALALSVAAQSGAVLDTMIGVLIMGSIGLPILGPPHRAKNALAAALFLLALVGTGLALLSELIS
jgi:hypothetical protein